MGASLWLSHGMPGQARPSSRGCRRARSLPLTRLLVGQDTPNRLVSGLRRLTHVEEWLTLVPATHAAELGMKRRAHDERLSSVCVAEPQSLAAQAECLEAFLDYLPKRYPESYSLAGAGAERAIAVAATGERHRVADFAACPLELCGRLVQEDLALMRALPEHERGADAAGNRHVLSAASVVFSFGGLADKMGKPLAFLHAPVPGYEADMAKLLNRTFDAIEVDKRARPSAAPTTPAASRAPGGWGLHTCPAARSRSRLTRRVPHAPPLSPPARSVLAQQLGHREQRADGLALVRHA